ncbi:MAG: Gfo/Idh/MocA family oxidoreductase [Victivallales bacterium]|nr:Gfo/Idh/MocA family oxidoreductase [Victivallales bacterium]
MAKTSQTTRRTFLKTAGAVAVPMIVPASVFGANAPSNRITIASIGVGKMGGGNLGAFLHRGDTQVVAVCDVDAPRAEGAKKRVEKHYSERLGKDYKGCDDYQDLRKIIERDDIDAVCISTADHWHVPAALMAVRSGKDVYCEKPLSLTIHEGRVLSDAVRQYGRVFQMGSMQRSDRRFRFACELVRNGRIGEIKHVKVGLSKGRAHAPVKPQKPPEGLNWDLYVGPSPWRHYHKDCCHYNFRFISDFSGGQMLNWGSHHLDIAQWGLGTDRSGPVEVKGKGVFATDGPYDNPVKYEVDYRYADGITLNCSTSNRTGARWEGSKGWVYVTRGKIDASSKSLLRSIIRPEEIHLVESRSHHGQFIECIRSRRETVTPCEVGHRSASMGHMGNIAMRLGKTLAWNPETERFDDDEANRLLSRPTRGPWSV